MALSVSPCWGKPRRRQLKDLAPVDMNRMLLHVVAQYLLPSWNRSGHLQTFRQDVGKGFEEPSVRASALKSVGEERG